jgi:hypothetical protein
MPVILPTQEVEIKKITVQVQLRQKIHKTLSRPIKKLGAVAHICYLRYTRKNRDPD